MSEENMTVKFVIDYEALRERCNMPQESFWLIPGFQKYSIKTTTTSPGGVRSTNTRDDDWYLFQDNGANILAVAHLDNVNPATRVKGFGVVEYENPLTNTTKKIVYAPQLDDRLGVYIILDLLPALFGCVPYDILFTTNEEIGQSTARDFVPPAGKVYNWVIEFDRRGDDVVLYKYENPDWKRALEEAGFRIGVGSVSDISYLDLGVCAANVGVGYHDEHNVNASMLEHELVGQIEKFYRFFQTNSNVLFPFDPTIHKKVYSSTQYWSGGEDWGDSRFHQATWPPSGASAYRSWPTTKPTLPKLTAPDNFDWVTDSAVCDATSFSDGLGKTFKCYTHKETKIQATRCSVCNQVAEICDFMWTKTGLPICPICYNDEHTPDIDAEAAAQDAADLLDFLVGLGANGCFTRNDLTGNDLDILPVILDEDEVTWLTEDVGGLVWSKEKDTFVRVKNPSINESTFTCSECGECEYVLEGTRVVKNSDRSSPSEMVCRFCMSGHSHG